MNQVNFLAQCTCGKALCKFEQPTSLRTCFEKSWTLKKHQFSQVLTETSRGPNPRGDPLQAYQRRFHYFNSVVGTYWQRLPNLGSIGTVSVEKLTKTNCTRRCARRQFLRSLVGLPEHLIQRVAKLLPTIVTSVNLSYCCRKNERERSLQFARIWVDT